MQDTGLSDQVNTPPLPSGTVNPHTQDTATSSKVNTASLYHGPHHMREPALFSSAYSRRPACQFPVTSDTVKATISAPTPLANFLQTPATPAHTSLHNKANIAAQQHANVSTVSPHHSHPAHAFKAAFVSSPGVNTCRTISHPVFASPSRNNASVTTPTGYLPTQWLLQGQI